MSSGFRLIVAEKPSVARDIARVLKVKGGGKGWIGAGAVRISWCVGHLVELAEPQAYDPAWKSWRLDLLPMIPEQFKLKPRASARDQWKILRGLLREDDLGEVVNACDAGREGELIFAHVYQLSGCRSPVQRLWISSMTDQAIRAGFGALRPGPAMNDLEAAARCRAEADWLVGINATRAMTLRMRSVRGSTLLSLGRVQTPTLSLLDEREAAIETFEPKPFWMVKVRFARKTDESPEASWEATWTGEDAEGKRTDRLFDEADAQAILERIEGQIGVVTRVERKKTRERPPLLYDLTTLQKEANKRFGFSAQQTLDLAQALYENHKVLTYPRTDARHIGSDQVSTLQGLFEALRFDPYRAAAEETLSRWPFDPGSRIVDDAEVSDHHAIIPTGTDPRKSKLSTNEKRVFDLVARRFLAVFAADAVFAAALVETTIDDDLFVAKGRTLLEPGWRTIDPPAADRKKAKKKGGKEPEPELPPVNKDELVDQREAKSQEGVTKPPPRYTEASLLGAMERAGEALDEAELKRAMKRKGLGTPATRASIIETLLNRGYVTRSKKHVVPTDQGRALLEALPVEALRSPRLTGQWEARLNSVAEGEESREAFMADIRAFVTDAVRQLVEAEVDEEVKASINAGAATEAGAVIGPCPRCGEEVTGVRWGWACSACSLSIPQKVARREVSERMAKALLTDKVTAPVKGFRSKAGKTFRAALAFDDEFKVVFSFPERDSLGTCPACSKPVRRRGKYYTCDSGRECPFIVSVDLRGQTLEDDHIRHLLDSGQSAVIDGFEAGHGGDGRTTKGRLEWRNNRVLVVPVDERAEAGPAGRCPRCGGTMAFTGKQWRCDGCPMSIPATVARRELRHAEVAAVLAKGRTKRLYGFRHQTGAPFKAALKLDDEKGVALDFEKREDDEREPIPPGGPPPAFGERVDCPVCLGRARRDPGYVIAGREAWGCSCWREGCHFRVPFAIYGVPLPEEEARRLLSSKKATRYLETPMGEPGKRKACRVVLDIEQDPCWSLEPKTKPRRR